jgi:hypothetical protein
MPYESQTVSAIDRSAAVPINCGAEATKTCWLLRTKPKTCCSHVTRISANSSTGKGSQTPVLCETYRRWWPAMTPVSPSSLS